MESYRGSRTTLVIVVVEVVVDDPEYDTSVPCLHFVLTQIDVIRVIYVIFFIRTFFIF